METDIVKMSPKGQLVVPQFIREKEGFIPGDRFISILVEGGILFKKVDFENLKKDFERFSKKVEKQFKRNNVTAKDVEEAVKWARKSS